MRLLFIILTLLFLTNSFNSHSQVYGEEVISWDFNNGIPNDWVNFSSTGISQWEYRGPSTTPNNSVASRGSCGNGSSPVLSTSQENGFIIFDSNYWDDEIGPCGNLGSGLDPAPHLAHITTTPLDFSNENSLVLTFQQQFSNYQCATTVLISTDGGNNYQELVANPTQIGFISNEVDVVSINISDIAGNTSDVRIRFQFSGLYYYWMLDDIVIYTPNQNDLLLKEARNTAFDNNQGDTGLSKMEYTSYADDMIEPFQFHADVLNIGDLTQTGITLTANVFDETNELLASINASSSSIGPSNLEILSSSIYTPPSEIGKYHIDFSLSQDQVDEDFSNNTYFKEFEITDYSWGRDKGVMEGEYSHTSNLQNIEFMNGNYFESITQNELKCTSISVAFSDSSEVGAQAYTRIYNYSRDNILAQSQPYTINEWDLNSTGDSKWVTIQLENPLILSDSLYLAMAGSEEIEGRVRIATSGDSPPFTSMLLYPNNNQLFYTLVTPMVRMNLFPLDAHPGCTNEEAMNYDEDADVDDGSCRIAGCTDPEFSTYNPEANFEDGSCATEGCPDPEADNYNPNAQILNEDICIYLGCTDPEAINYDSQANENDGSCLYNDAALDLSNSSGCVPFSVDFINQTSTSSEGTCTINLGDGTIINDCDLTEFSHTYSETGEFQVTYTYTVGEFESTFSEVVTVSPSITAPIITFNGQENQILCSNCENADNFNWILDDEVILENAPFDIINPQNGTYVLELDNGSNCTAQSEPLIVVSVTDYENFTWNTYPNPVQSILQIETNQNQLDFTLSNSTGKIILSGKIIGKGTHSIDLSTFSSGIYILKGTSGSNELIKKIVKN